MSSRAYATNDSFYANQNKIRAIVQIQLQKFFTDIKDQIEYKIQQIDQNILQLKRQIKKVQQKTTSQKQYQPTQILDKLSQLQKRIEQIRIHKQRQIQKIADQIKNKSFDRSYERRQQKSPLFRKSAAGPSLDLNNIIFGDENIKPNSISIPDSMLKINQLKNGCSSGIARPPLPHSKKVDTIQYKSQPDLKQVNYARNYEYQKKNEYQHQYKSDNEIQIHEKKQQRFDNQIAQNLNKNKNSFMRKKSLKKIGTIPQQQIEESILSNK